MLEVLPHSRLPVQARTQPRTDVSLGSIKLSRKLKRTHIDQEGEWVIGGCGRRWCHCRR